MGTGFAVEQHAFFAHHLRSDVRRRSTVHGGGSQQEVRLETPVREGAFGRLVTFHLHPTCLISLTIQ